MNVLLRHPLLAILFAASAAQAAPVVTVEGFIGRGPTAVTGVFTATVEATADNGDVLVAETFPSLAVDDGTFSVDLDLGDDGATALAGGQVVTITVDIGEGIEAAARIGTIYRVASGETADRAGLAREADRLGDILPADLVADGASLGSPIAFANLTVVPAGVADGVDNGTVDTLTGLAITGGVLNVAAGGVLDVAAGSLNGVHILDGSITSTQLGPLAADRIANGTLTGANFANAAIPTAAEVTGTANIFKLAAGCDRPFELTSSSVCVRRTCTIGGVDCVANQCRVPCTGGPCENLGPSPSGGTLACTSAAEGMAFVGRVIKDP